MAERLIINGEVVEGAELIAYPISDLETKVKTVELPWANGVLDVSTALSGGQPIFKERTLKLVVRERANDPDERLSLRLASWAGRVLTATVPGHLNGYYIGRANVLLDAFQVNVVRYTIVATVDPWYLDTRITTVTVTATSGGKAFTLTPALFSVAPFVSTTDVVTISANGSSWALPAGVTDRVIPGLVLEPGKPLSGTVKGAGTVTFSWRGGVLL